MNIEQLPQCAISLPAETFLKYFTTGGQQVIEDIGAKKVHQLTTDLDQTNLRFSIYLKPIDSKGHYLFGNSRTKNR